MPFRLSVLANRMTRAVARVYMRRLQLSAPEWRTMAVLGRFGAMTANSVVERTAMDKVRVSRAVTRLLAAGHITRRTDPEDRRRAILDLTPTGIDGLSPDRAAGARGRSGDAAGPHRRGARRARGDDLRKLEKPGRSTAPDDAED